MAEATEAATTTNETAATSPAATPSTTEPSLLAGEVKPEPTEATTTTTPAEGTKPAEPPAKLEGAPEKYEFKAPEGQTYDPQILSAFEAAAKDSNLSQAAAQKLLDTMSPQIAHRQLDQAIAIRKGWVEQSRTDTEFGGVNLESNLAIAKKGYDKFASPALKTLLDSTGLGSHPDVIRMFVNIGKAISEDTFVGGSAGAGKTNMLDVLYDKTAPAR